MVKSLSALKRVAWAIVAVLLLTSLSFARSVAKTRSGSATHVRESASVEKSMVSKRKKRGTKKRVRRHRWVERFYTSSFADDVVAGDVTTGEDPVVRAAAVDALGNMNGSVVAIDPSNGRILAMVNQKLALSQGAIPCSTVKIPVALAALSEGLVDRETKVKLGARSYMNLSKALAVSNNQYFEAIGRQLGFEKVSYYAHLYGLGELAGYNVEGEHLGVFPDAELDAKLGGIGKMCSFGESIYMTPMQLGALTSAISNGGTLYWLQHPTSTEEVANFRPLVKRTLDITPQITEMFDGLRGAVEYGTARTVRYNFIEEEVLGKTGTCSQEGTRYGWCASYANTQYGRIVVVVFLRGGHQTYGPKAAEIAGKMYRQLYDHAFFAIHTPPVQRDVPVSGLSQE